MASFDLIHPKPKKKSPLIQPKLTIGQPNDKYEQEADRMAEQVMRMPAGPEPLQRQCEDCEEEGLQMKPLAEGITPVVQRQTGGEEDPSKKAIDNIGRALKILEDESLNPKEKVILLQDVNFNLEELPYLKVDPSLVLPLKELIDESLPLFPHDFNLEKLPLLPSEPAEPLPTKELEDETLPLDPFLDEIFPEMGSKLLAKDEEETTLQTKTNGNPSTAPSSSLESRLNSKKGQGAALPESTQQSMSQAFGADFSGVKVHTDGEAVQMNQELGAKAFTHGSDVYFNRGQYNPGSGEGKRLLGHELTHVVQQGGGKMKKLQFQLDKPKPGRRKWRKRPGDKKSRRRYRKTKDITGTRWIDRLLGTDLKGKHRRNTVRSNRRSTQNSASSVNITFGTPFVGQRAQFINPNQANILIQNIANVFLTTPGASRIFITINTDIGRRALGGMVPGLAITFNQLMQQRANLVRNGLIAAGVPNTAFPRTWFFVRTSRPNPSVNVRIQ